MAEASIAVVATRKRWRRRALTGCTSSVEAVNWPDAALGCPQPDMIYAAVITPGYRVVLETADARFVVHTDSRIGGEQIICPEE
jgi:hypothetical protein